MKKIIIGILVSLIFFACSEKKKNSYKQENIRISDSLMPCKELSIEKVELPEEFAASRYYVISDSILLIVHDKAPDPYYVSIVNMNNMEIINQLYMRGNGPNDLLSIFAYINKDYVCIEDFTKSIIMHIKTESLLSKSFKYPSQTKIKDTYGGFNWINDTTIVITNGWYYEEMIKNDSVPELLYLDNNGEYIQNYPKTKSGIFSANYSGGFLATNKEKKVFYYAKKTHPEIIFYKDTMPIKIYYGPDEDNTEFQLEQNTILRFKDNYHYYYYDYCASTNNVFFKNLRSHGKVGENPLEKEKQTTEIFRLDWDGNLIGRYKIRGKNLAGISFCEETNTLYVTSYDEVEERTLYKAVLPN